MSYQVLARKWRPKSFSEVVGQQHVLKILSNALSLGRVHHAYLFSGTRGVGKTSIARLLAKGLNCESGITATLVVFVIIVVRLNRVDLLTYSKLMLHHVLKSKILGKF